MWTYNRINRLFSNGTSNYTCYAGQGDGLNNPDFEAVHDVGPLPEGKYKMTALINSPHTGPNTIILEPEDITKMYGRSGFRIHGDNQEASFSASNGCIVMAGGGNRLTVWNSGDHELEVL
jgi:hypothetical protein